MDIVLVWFLLLIYMVIMLVVWVLEKMELVVLIDLVVEKIVRLFGELIGLQWFVDNG